jgi:hypothetical protein
MSPLGRFSLLNQPVVFNRDIPPQAVVDKCQTLPPQPNTHEAQLLSGG